jgi:hypothetical protein
MEVRYHLAPLPTGSERDLENPERRRHYLAV